MHSAALHKRVLRSGVLAAVCVGALCLAACGSSSSSGTSASGSTTPATGATSSSTSGGNSASTPFLIGVVQPLTGPFGTVGADILHATQAEAALLNAKGGILGHQIKVIYADDGSDVQRGISATQQMVDNNKLNLFIPDAVNAQSQLPFVKNLLSFSNCSQAVCGDGSQYPLAFTTNPPASVQVPPLIAYAKKEGWTKVGVLAQNTSDGQFFTSQVQKLAASAGLPGYEVLQYQHSYLRPRTDLPGLLSPDGSQGLAGGDLLSYLRAEPQLTMVAYSPLLKGGYVNQDKLDAAEFAEFDHPGTPARLAALREVAKDAGATVNQVVLAWLIGGQVPVIPLVGASSLAQLDESLAAVDLELTSEQRTRLDAAR